jgi:hypothetical protein
VGFRNEIVNQVYDEDRDLVEKTLKFVIYEEISKTWGVVNKPNAGVFTFRMKNTSSDKLKYTVDKMIKGLTVEAPHYERDGKPAVSFSEGIEVLEPASDKTAFYGTIINTKPLGLAIKERRREVFVGIVVAGLAVTASLLSMPPFIALWQGAFWADWIAGNLARMATAALAAMIISWAEVYLHWRDIRREAPIRWVFERSSHSK